MSKIKQFFKNISPLNNRTDMPGILYIIKVFIIFQFVGMNDRAFNRKIERNRGF